MQNEQKMELIWADKYKTYSIESKKLQEIPELSYKLINNDNDIFDNKLIFGDNLIALKYLEKEFTNKIKCIYIDPPYNTNCNNTYYKDNFDSNHWLSMLQLRIKLLKNLLSEDGSLWISINDSECHYLKVLCDEIFGINNFIATIVWEKKYSPQNNAKLIANMHEYILIYVKNKEQWKPNFLNNEMRYKTLWERTEVGDTQESKREILALNNTNIFTTPKPERLIKRILDIATNPNDWVLDAFAGSGTTGAVAHKMYRKWIMIEIGEHCNTFIIPRIKKVINGEDPNGITNIVNWTKGGGYKYYNII